MTYTNHSIQHVARDRYSCGDKCLKRTEPCQWNGNTSCPQHYTLCGNRCIDR